MSIGGVIFCASLIVSMINITGLMMKTSAIILSFSQGKLLAHPSFGRTDCLYSRYGPTD